MVQSHAVLLLHMQEERTQEQGLETPKKIALGESPDIFALLKFTFWQKALYHSHNELFPDARERMGHFLEVSE